jgi:peptidoglycan/xylan/chitin deacetylase (PgdA/CDA1 family)
MAGDLNFGGKRELLARGLHWSGASFLLAHLPARDALLVLNYHRIGTAADDLFDPGVFSATADELDHQIGYLKRHLSLVTLDEALAFLEGTDKEKTHRCRVLITFDDGYLDNYDVAFPILRSHGAQGVFFLATSMVGSCEIPWWDRIAYLVKTACNRQFTLRFPADLAVDLDRGGLDANLIAILKLYKLPENTDPQRFLHELAQASQGEEPPGTLRRFLNWEEAGAMIRGGMAIGSHTHSHHLLSQLEPERQLEELVHSRAVLKDKLAITAESIAYPVGARSSFTGVTQQMARNAGYRAAFSFYGGVNFKSENNPFNILRVGIGGQSRNRFSVQAAVCRFTGKYWP